MWLLVFTLYVTNPTTGLVTMHPLRPPLTFDTEEACRKAEGQYNSRFTAQYAGDATNKVIAKCERP